MYDFQRMTTKNTIEHLAYVAEKEGYTAEPEALALIAEKADGGMRDALSIFDQMVSFSGGNITYENVCQNLNVLNQEYYFKLVDYFLESKVSDCLLLFNEVLQKGFDGGNFVAGLATHMRNLLVSRDAVTLPLLEMSEKMRARYQEQALRCPIRFVYKVLKLANDCDQAYRTSRNKRLQVEICLIQSAAKETTEEAAPLQLPRGGENNIDKNKKEPVKQNNTQQTPPPQVVPEAVKQVPPQGDSEGAKRPLPKVSFKHIGAAKKQEIAESEQKQEKKQEEHPVEPINSEKLTAAWFAFLDSLPHESVALAERLKGLQPTVKDDNTAVLSVSNPQIQQTIENMMPQILNVTRRELRNFDFTLETRLEELQEVVKSYSPSEMLKAMKRQNVEVGELVSKMQLKFD